MANVELGMLVMDSYEQERDDYQRRTDSARCEKKKCIFSWRARNIALPVRASDRDQGDLRE